MAVTKIWAIKDSLQRVLDYAANPDKTEYDALAQTLHYAENDAKTKLNESAQLVTGIHCRIILKINALPADKKASFSAEEIFLMRSTINQLRNDQLAKGQYTDAADDMLLKLF